MDKMLKMKRVKTWQDNWKYPTYLVCIYGFFYTVRPLGPFMLPYLTGPEKNFTERQVVNEMFPMGAYGSLAAQVPVFLLTDWLRYKPVVIFQCVTLFISTAMCRWSTSVPEMQASEFLFGVAAASEVAYYSYIYSMVDLNKYRKATSYVRSVQLLGHTVGSVFGQLSVSFKFLSFNDTAILTLILLSFSLVASFLLPMPQWSMFFHQKTKGTNTELSGEHIEQTGKIENEDEEKKTSNKSEDRQDLAVAQTCGNVFLQMIRDARDCFKSKKLLYWSLWWVLATCGFSQVEGFIQPLWEHVKPSQNASIYNGGVEAVSSLMSAATVYGLGYTENRWDQWEELALGGFSGLCSVALFVMTFSSNIWVNYASYVIFKCLYMVLMALAMFHIATGLTMERYALVFGVNYFTSGVIQAIFVSAVVSSKGLGLTIVPQFIIYSSYFLVITAIFLLRGIYIIWSRTTRKQIPVPSMKNEPYVCAEHKF